jgi:hypothetical protein
MNIGINNKSDNRQISVGAPLPQGVFLQPAAAAQPAASMRQVGPIRISDVGGDHPIPQGSWANLQAAMGNMRTPVGPDLYFRSRMGILHPPQSAWNYDLNDGAFYSDPYYGPSMWPLMPMKFPAQLPVSVRGIGQ